MTADIAEDCLDNSAGVYVNFWFLRGCSTPWTVVAATVELYDLNSPSTVEVLDFTGSSFLITLALDGTGDVLGWTSWVTSERRSGLTWPTTDGSVVNPYFALGMTYDRTTRTSQARLGWSRDDPSCLRLPKDFDIPACFDGFNDARNFPAQVTFSFVPEPGTLALIAAALGFAGAATRRRRA